SRSFAGWVPVINVFPVPKSLGADLNAQNGGSSLVVIGTVAAVRPQIHWIEVYGDDPVPSPPSLMTADEAERAHAGSGRDFYITDVVVTVNHFLRRPSGVPAASTLNVRV